MYKFASLILILFFSAVLPINLKAAECNDQNITGKWKDGEITWEIKKNGSIICSCNNCYCGDPVERTIPTRKEDVIETTCATYEGKPISWKLKKESEIVIFFTKGFAIMNCTVFPEDNKLLLGELTLKSDK